jgi:hypothetical protein
MIKLLFAYAVGLAIFGASDLVWLSLVGVFGVTNDGATRRHGASTAKTNDTSSDRTR